MATGTYTTVTLGDALNDMGGRLMDPHHVRWPVPELKIYIREAIRTYNALTGHFRDEASFVSASPEPFYYLPTVLPTLREQTFSVGDAVDQICWQLLEPPPVGGLWVGTLQYNLQDVLSALQEARDTFLLETGIVQTISQLPVSPFPSDGAVDLPEEIINLRRLGWLTADGITTLLRRDDQWGLTNYRPAWQAVSARPPRAYSVSTQPPLVVQLAPVSSVPGTLNLLTVNRGGTVSMVAPTTPLGVPNDWAWVVIFGALGQLFQRDGVALDDQRAQYCNQRWQHGLQQARAASVVLSARIQGIQCELASVADADLYSASWPLVAGIPKVILTAGHTVVALNPPPGVPTGGGDFTVLLQVVRNAPIPVLDSDPIQIGPELTNDLLDYAQHLALIKEGGPQIAGNKGLLDQFMTLTGTTLAMKWASDPQEIAATDQTMQDAVMVPYRNG
jgi:hypothetical protein